MNKMPTLEELRRFVADKCPGMTRRGASPDGYDCVRPQDWAGARAITTHYKVVHDGHGWRSLLVQSD